MRKLFFRPCFVVATMAFSLVTVSVDGKENKDRHDENLKNLRFTGFQADAKPIGEIIEDEETILNPPNQKWTEEQVKLWESAIKEAAVILPPILMKNLGEINFVFYINQYTWETAHVERNTVYVNLLPNTKKKPKWMTWEAWSLNGFTREEMVFVSLHEIAHIYDIWGERFDGLYYGQYSGISWWNGDTLETISSVHCEDSVSSWDKDSPVSSGRFKYRGTIFEVGMDAKSCHVHEFTDDSKILSFENQPTFYGRERGVAEDFADTFALYVMFPEYLKNFSFRYEIIKNVLNKEYSEEYSKNGSLPSRLTFVVERVNKTSGEER